MAKFLNTILNDILVSLQTDYNVYEVFDVEDANVVLNDVQGESFPIAFFSIKNNATLTLDRHKKTYPSYSIAVWLLNLYEEDNKSELETNYEGLRLDAMEFVQRFQRVEEFSRVPSNLTISPNIEEFDSNLDLLATALQISFTASVDIGEDTSRVCVPLNVSSFTLDDSDLENVVLDASASSFRGVTSGATEGFHAWTFTLDTTTINISGLATEPLSSSDITLLSTIGMDGAIGDYNSFTFAKNPLLSVPLNFAIQTSHTYDLRGKGAVSVATTNEVRKRVFFEFNTTWNNSTDGIFDVFLIGGAKTWIFGTDTTNGDNSDYSGNFLDGTLKTVRVVSTEFGLVTSIDFEDYKIIGDLDFSLFTGSPDLLIDNNTSQTAFSNSITNLVTPDNGVDSFACRFYQGTGLNLKVNGGTFQVDFSPNLFDLVFVAESTVNNFSASLLPSLLNIDLSNVQHLGGTFDLNTNTSVVTDLTLNTIDSSSVTRINFTGRKIRQAVDLGSYNMSGSLNLLNCEITDLTTPTGTLTGTTNIRNNRFTQFNSVLALNGNLQGGLSGDLNELLKISSGNISSISSSSGALSVVDFGSGVISSATAFFSLADNAMTTAEVDAVWIEIDRVAVFTGIARVLNAGGNDAPSVTSLSARNSLIGKGYLLTI